MKIKPTAFGLAIGMTAQELKALEDEFL